MGAPDIKFPKTTQELIVQICDDRPEMLGLSKHEVHQNARSKKEHDETLIFVVFGVVFALLSDQIAEEVLLVVDPPISENQI